MNQAIKQSLLDLRTKYEQSISLKDLSPERSYELAVEGLEQSRKLSSKELELFFLHEVGVHYLANGEIDESITNFIDALELALDLDDSGFMIKLYTRLGAAYHKADNTEKALEYYFSALAIDREELHGWTYNNIAVLYKSIGNIDRSLHYLEKAMKINRKIADSRSLGCNLINLANLYMDMGETKNAREYYDEAETLCEQNNLHRFLISASFNLVTAMQKEGDLEEALTKIEATIEICKKYGFHKNHLECLCKKAEVLTALDRPGEAEKTLEKARSFLIENDFPGIEEEILNQLLGLKKAQNNYKEALELSEKINSLTKQSSQPVQNKKLELLIQAKEKQLSSLKVKTEQVQALCDEINEYAHILSHDLKAPLRTIASFTELIRHRDEHGFSEEQNDLMNFVVQGVKKMNTTLDDLQKYSSIKLNPSRANNFRLKDILMSVCEQYSECLNRAGAEIKIEELPEIRCDQELIKELFSQLLSNSLKFRSEKNPIIRVVYEMVDDTHVIRFKDNGIGIKRPFRDQIFDLFTKLNGDQTDESTGVGLAICKKITMLHGGSIHVCDRGSVDGLCIHLELRSLPSTHLFVQ